MTPAPDLPASPYHDSARIYKRLASAPDEIGTTILAWVLATIVKTDHCRCYYHPLRPEPGSLRGHGIPAPGGWHHCHLREERCSVRWRCPGNRQERRNVERRLRDRLRYRGGAFPIGAGRGISRKTVPAGNRAQFHPQPTRCRCRSSRARPMATCPCRREARRAP
jgi:hypothetical protein